MKQILFLDFDGVLNGIDSGRRTVNERGETIDSPVGIDPVCVARLNAICSQVPDMQIVMSSAWRHWFDKARAHLVVAGFLHDDRIIGKTEDDVSGWQPSNERGQQIARWLAANAPDAEYAILDDDEIDGHGARFVQTWFSDSPESTGTGLTERHAARVVSILRDGVRADWEALR